MKRIILPLILLIALAQSALSQQIEIYFSPKGGCTEAVVKELNAAQTTILVQAYSFTSVPIAKALVDAHKRGVKIEVILDKSQRTEKYSSADFVQHAGIPIRIDDKHAIAHNKVMVIDGTVITGSFNFTKAAEESNAENLLVIRDKEIAEQYTANWKKHAEHSEVYEGKEKGYSETVQAAPAAIYIASKNSQVFHKADCKSAAKISEKNLIHYATREEAIQAGKRPCAECKP